MKNKRMFVFCQFFDPHKGGVEQFVGNFYKNLNEKCKTQIYIVTSQYDKQLLTEEKHGKIHIFRYPSITIIPDKYYIPSPKGIFLITDWIRQYKPDEIHTHTRFYLAHCYVALLTIFFAYKYFHIEHGTSFVKDGNYLVRLLAFFYDQTFSRFIFFRAHGVFAITHATSEFIKKNYLRNVDLVLPHATDFPLKVRKHGGKSKEINLLFVGRIVKAKGIWELLHAFVKIKHNFGKKITLHIVGEGTELIKIKDFILKNEIRDVYIYGRLSRLEVIKTMDKCDILILPSYTEGLPSVILEALSRGLVVIATNVGGISEILPNKYLIDYPFNEKQLARKIVNIIKKLPSHEREVSKLQGKLTNYHWPQTVEKYLTFMRNS